MITCWTAPWSSVSCETGPSRPVVATTAVIASSSGTPAATAAPNATSRISRVRPSEIMWPRLSSSSDFSLTILLADASPNSSTRTSGWAAWTSATAASGAATACSVASASPGRVKFTTTERPSAETVFARCSAFERALDLGDAVDALEALDDVLDGRADLRTVGARRRPWPG